MSSVISGIGIANPKYHCRQAELFEFMCDAHQLTDNECNRLRKLYDVSGIDYRYSVLPDFCLRRGDFQFFGNGPALTPFPSTKDRMVEFQKSAKEVAAGAVDAAINSRQAVIKGSNFFIKKVFQ